MQKGRNRIAVQREGRRQCKVYAVVQVGGTPQGRGYTQGQGVRPNALQIPHLPRKHSTPPFTRIVEKLAWSIANEGLISYPMRILSPSLSLASASHAKKVMT